MKKETKTNEAKQPKVPKATKPEVDDWKPFVPLDQDEIREIDADIASLRRAVSIHKSSVIRLAKLAQTIDAHEAKQLKVLIQAYNIKNGATEIAQYFGLAEMTLENIHQDMNAIYDAKDAYMRKIYEQQEAIAEQAAIAQKNREEAKRLAEKRKAEKINKHD